MNYDLENKLNELMKCGYNDVQEIRATINYLCEVYDALVSCGIPKRDVHHFVKPQPSSGYSMGEVVITSCNGKEICRVNNTQEYAKSCKWRAKHGVVFVEFTKTTLRRYIDMLKRDDIGCYRLMLSCINISKSDLTRKQVKEYEDKLSTH